MTVENKIDLFLNESSIQSIGKSLINSLKGKSFDKVKSSLKSNFNKMIDIIIKNGLEKDALKIINRKFKTNHTSLKALSKVNEDTLNEDLKHFWEMFRMEGWGAVSIFPTLSLWFELDRLLDGAGISDLNFKKIIVYGVLWIVLILGKHLAGYKRWKKENPEEYEQEGKPGLFSWRKK